MRICEDGAYAGGHNGRRLPYLGIGDGARIALRWKAPTLRYYFDHRALPRCAYGVLPDAERGAHFLTCPQLPAALSPPINRARTAIRTQSGLRRVVDVNAAFNRLCWHRQDVESIGLVLDAMSAVLRAYRD